MTQCAITNFNPTTAVVWPHNDLNVSSVYTGLSSGFHILRAHVCLPRPGQSSVYGTYSQTFYYDGGLPGGAIVYPASGSTIGTGTYTVVVRADSTVTGVQFNIQNTGTTNNWDSVTGQTNGIGNTTNGQPVWATATAVSPNQTMSLQYTNYPQEYRFVYTNVPGTGTATINVKLLEYGTAVYTNHYATLTATVNTLAPQSVVTVSSPSTNGTVIPYATNSTYQIAACFSPSLSGLKTNFNVLINGVLQPQGAYILQASGPCSGMKVLYYNWTNPQPGTNQIQVIYTNNVVPIGDTRNVVVTPPLKISGLESNNQLLMWGSVPGVEYQVLATTNLALPFTSISGTVPSQGTTSSYYDPNPSAQKYYKVVLLPAAGN